MTATWCDFAERVDGAAGKVNPGTLHATGAVLHSAEGYEASMISIVQSLHSGVSWHFSVMKDGRLLEHYPLEAKCWHAHAVGNEHYIGIEHEGVAGEPETDEQVGTDIRLLAWLGETLGWPAFERGAQLFEHHEVPGNATACPSGRIDWLRILKGLTPMPEQDAKQNMLDLISGLDALYEAERLPDNPLGQKVFVLHLKSGGDPNPPIVIAA